MTRDELLRASGLAAFGLAFGGCSLTGSDKGNVPTLATRGGDAWAWERTVAGSARGCDAVTLRVNGREVPAATKGDAFQADVRLGPGENRVEAACGNGSGQEIVLRQRLTVRPVARIDVKVTRDEVTLDGSSSEPSEATGSAISSYAWSERDGNPESLDLGTSTGPQVTFAAPKAHGEYFVTLDVTDGDGNTDRSTTYFVVDANGAKAVDMASDVPAWIDSAIVYGVIPFLFGEKPFAAVTERLPYLRDLGVNALWLSPITRSPGGDFGYAVIDYFRTNPEYGTEEEFRTLVSTAHENGIRVLMDFIPNHSSDEHPYFVDAKKHGKRSPYWTFYDRDETGQYTYYFDWENLPNFNYDNPEMRRFITEAFTHWVREYDVDGFRVDACWGVKRRRPDYWAEWRRELKRIKPDLLLLAEASALDPWYYENGFDVAYDWTKELGHWAWGDVFYDTPSIGESLDYALGADSRPGRVFHFLNNNDTGPRFISTYDSDTTRVAAALLLTLPGLPCVYTGDEIGAQYEPYSDRFPIHWDEDTYNLRPWYTKLCHLRREQPSLQAQQWTPVKVGPQRSGLYAYLRHGAEGREPLLVLLNFARDVFDAELEVPASFGAIAGASSLRDILNDRDVAVKPGMRIHIDALDAMVLSPAGGSA